MKQVHWIVCPESSRYRQTYVPSQPFAILMPPAVGHCYLYPTYFVEVNRKNENPHDNLHRHQASSAKVIMNGEWVKAELDWRTPWGRVLPEELIVA
jgi:hypothetical protein